MCLSSEHVTFLGLCNLLLHANVCYVTVVAGQIKATVRCKAGTLSEKRQRGGDSHVKERTVQVRGGSRKSPRGGGGYH